jgi:hypothetical protein
MSKSYLVLIHCIFYTALLAGCSVGPYEEPEDPQVPEGPGVFSGADGELTYSDFFGDGKKKARRKGGDNSQTYYPTYSDVDVPAVDEQSFRDFEEFKAWRRAQDPKSPDFQEYQDWRAYQQYRRFKAKGAQEPSPARENK